MSPARVPYATSFPKARPEMGDDGDGDGEDVELEEYEGELVDGAPHGHGKAIYLNGAEYNGRWEDGVRQGEGKLKDEFGCVYAGLFVNDQPSDSSGHWEYSDGSTYAGAVVEGLRHGHGRYVWPDGTVYEGEWLTGKRSGTGTERSADGKVSYQGGWLNDEPHGQGQGRVSGSKVRLGARATRLGSDMGSDKGSDKGSRNASLASECGDALTAASSTLTSSRFGAAAAPPAADRVPSHELLVQDADLAPPRGSGSPLRLPARRLPYGSPRESRPPTGQMDEGDACAAHQAGANPQDEAGFLPSPRGLPASHEEGHPPAAPNVLRSQYDFLNQSLDTLELEMLEDMVEPSPTMSAATDVSSSSSRAMCTSAGEQPPPGQTGPSQPGQPPTTSNRRRRQWSFRREGSFQHTVTNFSDPDLVV